MKSFIICFALLLSFIASAGPIGPEAIQGLPSTYSARCQALDTEIDYKGLLVIFNKQKSKADLIFMANPKYPHAVHLMFKGLKLDRGPLNTVTIQGLISLGWEIPVNIQLSYGPQTQAKIADALFVCILTE